MERDPLSFVRRRAFGAHAAAVLLLAVALPVLWVGLDLVRVFVDLGLSRAGAGSEPVRLLRLVLPLPERLAEEPVVLLPGLPVPPDRVPLAVSAGLLAVVLILAALSVALAALRTRIGTRAVESLRGMMLEAIARTRPERRDDARHAASLVGESLARESGFLGGAVLVPLAAAGVVAVAVGYTLWTDWRLALAAIAGLSAGVTIWPRRVAAAKRAAESRLAEGAAHRRALLDLVRRLPAVHAHGTAESEQERLHRLLDQRRAAVASAERGLGATEAINGFLTVLAPLAIAATGAWFGPAAGVFAGEVVASALAVFLAMRAIDALTRWRASREAAQPIVEEIARALAALTARDRTRRGEPLPGAGSFEARDLGAADPATGARLSGLTLTLPMPSHVALVGEPGSGAEVLAALMGGRLLPTSGSLLYGEVDLAAVDPVARAERIGFAGGETVLLPGTLRENLLYGVRDAQEGPDLERRLVEAVTVVGLDRLAHARGLAGFVDPAREPDLAGAVVEARKAVLAALRERSLSAHVDPFEPASFNAHATLGENILFGVPVGDTFAEDNLAGHPFLRAVLDAEDLRRPLRDMGRRIAETALEMFADLPEGHALVERFSLLPPSRRAHFEALLAGGGEKRRGAAADAEAESLIGLALRYVERRHRLGLTTPDLEARIVAARRAFAERLPASLAPAIRFHDPEAFNPAASLEDNLLFGRIAHDRAGAERAVRALVREVLTERGLDADVLRVGLDTRIDRRGEGLSAGDVAALDLARCLIRRPDVVIAATILDGRTEEGAADLLARLRKALVGRGLVVVTGDLPESAPGAALDRVVRFDRTGVVGLEEDGEKTATL